MTKKGSLVIIGRHPVVEALQTGQALDKVMVDRLGSFPELADLCRSQEVPFQKVPREKLDKFGTNHQGVAAFRSMVAFSRIEEIIPHLFEQGQNPLVLILDRITDVGNFGAISRSAEVLGAHAILFPAKESAQVNADAVKRSSGALLRIPLCRVPNLNKAIQFLQDSGLKVVAADGSGHKWIHDVDMKQPLAVIFGSEGEGVARDLLRRADEIVLIPQSGQMDSLNVSVAAGIFLYEIQRQRLYNAQAK